MTPEAQRIAIAEACGWKQCKESNFTRGEYYGQMPNSLFRTQVPDYLNDLNACHEIEKVLLEKSDGVPPPDLFDDYCQRLGGSLFHCAHATAAQRCEAFLRTIGKWKDDK